MGQSIVVNEKPSSNPGVVRFETNRALTGMGHERYRAGTEVWGDRPPDELARRLLARGGVAGVQINGNVVTVDLEKGYHADGLRSIIENLYRFYPDGPAAPAAPAAGDDGEAEAPVPEAADAPEQAADAADATPATADDAPAPDHPTEEPATSEPAATEPATVPTDEPEPAASEPAASEPAAADEPVAKP